MVQWCWVPSQADQSIAYKEPFPMVVASHIWGSQWFRRHVFSDQTMRLWFTFYFPGHPRSPALRGCSIIYFLQLLTLISPSPHRIFLAFITTLLMLFPAFIGRNSGVWLPRVSPIQFQSLISFGSS